MESKNIEHYFTQAKQLPIAMSFAELSTLVSSKGVTGPPNKSWWNLNNILLMSTLTLFISTLLVWLGANNSNLTAQYQPRKQNYSTSRFVEEQSYPSLNKQSLNEQKNTLINRNKNNVSTSQVSSISELAVNQTNLIEKQVITPVFSKENRTQLNTKYPKSNRYQQSPLGNRQDKDVDTGLYEIKEQIEEFKKKSTVKLIGSVDGETKSLTKIIDVNELNLLLVQHKNGNIHIATWDQQKIEVTATFTLVAKKAEATQDGLNDFQLFLEKEGNKAKISTNWDELNNCICNSNSTTPKKGILKHLYFPSKNKVQTNNGKELEYEKFKIEYAIKVPENFNVDLSNKYGDIIITDNIANAKLNLFQGNVETKSLKNLSLTSKYGNSNIGNVELADIELFQAEANLGNSKEMKMQAKYSNVKIGNTKMINLYSFQTEIESEGDIEVMSGEIKYGEIKFISSNKINLQIFQSKLTAKNIKSLALNSSYSEIKVGEVGKLKFEKSFQSEIKLNKLGELVGELKYSDLNIGILKSSLSVVAFQGSISVKIVEANFNVLKLDTKYTDVDLKFDPDAKYDLKAETTYTSFNVPSEILTSTKTNGNYNNENHYAGTYNSSSTKVASKVNLNSFQGNIKLE